MLDDKKPPWYPTAGSFQGQALPDLSRIPQSRWAEVLRDLRTERARMLAAGKVPYELIGPARVAAMEATLYHGGIRNAASSAAGAPLGLPHEAINAPPEVDPPAERPARLQINFRLSRRDHRGLAEAAWLVGATPTQLARKFVVSGVERVLIEARRAAAD